MGTRRKARELSLKLLYQVEFSGLKIEEVPEAFWLEQEGVGEVREFTLDLACGTLKNLKEIDSLIEKYSTNWRLARMASVDRNLLRQATFELLYHADIPASVTLNESVEIAKKYGTEESSSFINGILDKIAKEKRDVLPS